MRSRKKALLAAGLLAGAAALTGCAGRQAPAATPTPAADEQATPEPATPEPQAPEGRAPEEQASGEQPPEGQAAEGEAPIPLRVGGRESSAGALNERGTLLLPIVETAELLGWQARQESAGDASEARESIALEKEGSRVSVTWTVSDNTIRQITWQRDGLLVPVDGLLSSREDVIYAPAAFFEAALDCAVNRSGNAVEVVPAEPDATPETALTQEAQ